MSELQKLGRIAEFSRESARIPWGADSRTPIDREPCHGNPPETLFGTEHRYRGLIRAYLPDKGTSLRTADTPRITPCTTASG